MKRSVRLVALPLAFVLLLTGCWNKKELNELSIVMAIGIDKHQDEYVVTAQVINPNEVGSNQRKVERPASVNYKASGKTIPEALHRMLGQAPRVLYLSHLRVLVFGEQVARQGLSEVLDYVTRSNELRTDFNLLVARNGDAEDILEVLTPFESVPANALFSSIMVAHKKWAATGKVTLQQFLAEVMLSGTNPVLPGVQVKGDAEQGESISNVERSEPKVTIKHTGLAVFNKDKLVGWLGEIESKSANYAKNEVTSTIGSLACPGSDEQHMMGLQVLQADSEIHPVLNGDNPPRFVIDLNISGNVSNVQCDLDFRRFETMKLIQKHWENYISSFIKASIGEVQQKYSVDIFGLGEALHREHPKVWSRYRDRWEEVFKTVKVDVNTQVDIRLIGSIVQPLKREVMQH